MATEICSYRVLSACNIDEAFMCHQFSHLKKKITKRRIKRNRTFIAILLFTSKIVLWDCQDRDSQLTCSSVALGREKQLSPTIWTYLGLDRKPEEDGKDSQI